MACAERLHTEHSSRLIQCLVSRRSTNPVHFRAICRRCAFRAGLIAWLANCVRSDARRRQSRSSLSNCSDFDIAHRLASPRANVARCRVSRRRPTPHKKTKRWPHEDPATCGLVEMLAKKAPRDAAGLSRKLSTSASPFRRRRKCNLSVFS
jgi:hypothetical protein